MNWFRIGQCTSTCCDGVHTSLTNKSGARRDPNLLIIARTDARGRRYALRLDAYWLRVRLEEDPSGPTRLLLLQRQKVFEIGRSLGAEDKRSLAEALREALGRYRSPIFDNPQLREPAAGA